jgi:hypothetical protein
MNSWLILLLLALWLSHFALRRGLFYLPQTLPHFTRLLGLSILSPFPPWDLLHHPSFLLPPLTSRNWGVRTFGEKASRAPEPLSFLLENRRMREFKRLCVVPFTHSNLMSSITNLTVMSAYLEASLAPAPPFDLLGLSPVFCIAQTLCASQIAKSYRLSCACRLQRSWPRHTPRQQ